MTGDGNTRASAVPRATTIARYDDQLSPPARTVAIVQSSYIPWKGYFDLIRHADHFILYDDAQYTSRDWRNRNRIKTKDGVMWLSIPVEVHGRRTQRVRDARVADPSWNRRHWKALATAYARAPYFTTYGEALEDLYGRATSPWLAEINRRFIEAICGWFGIATPLSSSSEYPLVEGRSQRLLDLCVQAGARRYLSGPSARDYLDAGLFERAGVAVSFIDYSGYPEYAQMYHPFTHTVTALDLLLNAGTAAARYLLPLPANVAV